MVHVSQEAEARHNQSTLYLMSGNKETTLMPSQMTESLRWFLFRCNADEERRLFVCKCWPDDTPTGGRVNKGNVMLRCKVCKGENWWILALKYVHFMLKGILFVFSLCALYMWYYSYYGENVIALVSHCCFVPKNEQRTCSIKLLLCVKAQRSLISELYFFQHVGLQNQDLLLITYSSIIRTYWLLTE